MREKFILNLELNYIEKTMLLDALHIAEQRYRFTEGLDGEVARFLNGLQSKIEASIKEERGNYEL